MPVSLGLARVRAEHAPRVLITLNHSYRISFQNISLIAKKMSDLTCISSRHMEACLVNLELP